MKEGKVRILIVGIILALLMKIYFAFVFSWLWNALIATAFNAPEIGLITAIAISLLFWILRGTPKGTGEVEWLSLFEATWRDVFTCTVVWIIGNILVRL